MNITVEPARALDLVVVEICRSCGLRLEDPGWNGSVVTRAPRPSSPAIRAAVLGFLGCHFNFARVRC
jgi:hypothetical protein